MDNQDKIKFKEAEAPEWYYKIDIETGQKISFADGKGSGTGLYKEMQAWIDAGNEIELQYTAEELAQKETQDQLNIQLNINSGARAFLNKNDWKITRHTRHEKLVELGELTQPALTEQEYKDLLIECQRQAALVID